MADGISTPETELSTKLFQSTNIPDKSIVTSQVSINSQRIGIRYDELYPYFDWIKEQAATQKGEILLTKGARMTVNNLAPDEAKWDAIVAKGEDGSYTLGRSIKEGANTCFQRAIFFNLLMQQAGVPTETLEGMWVESPRGDLRELPNEATFDKNRKKL